MCCLATELPQSQRAFRSGQEFPLFSQRVFVALDTGQGVVYAAASGWDRVYLLWLFRNFRSLAQNVLNPRQQRLIASLYREASKDHPHEGSEAIVVGTVEDFSPSSLPIFPSFVKAGKTARTSEKTSASVRALGLNLFFGRFAFNRITLKVGTAALVLAIAILAWHRLGAQPVVDSALTQTVAAAHPADEPIAIAKEGVAKGVTTKDLSPATVEPTSDTASPLASTNGESATASLGTAVPAVQRSEAPSARNVPQPTLALPAPTLAAVGKRGPNDATASTHHPVATSPKVYEASADQPRMQISGRPRKLVYPVCPETQARGKVSLQAVVGYDGAVSRVRVLTGDRTLAAAAIEAVRQWRYEPFSGTAPRLERETNITISFISNEVVAVSFPNSAPLSR
jgi:outer membrane biosynthesis protein TonB